MSLKRNRRGSVILRFRAGGRGTKIQYHNLGPITWDTARTLAAELQAVAREALVLRGNERKAQTFSGGSVYFIQNLRDGFTKVGFTTGKPEARLESLRTATSGHLRLLGTIPGSMATEKALHTRFAMQRVKGEWFCFRAEQMLQIQAWIGAAGTEPEAIP